MLLISVLIIALHTFHEVDVELEVLEIAVINSNRDIYGICVTGWYCPGFQGEGVHQNQNNQGNVNIFQSIIIIIKTDH